MSDQNFNQSIKHFCGGSNATGLFMEANYHGNNYTSPMNSLKSPELLFGTSLENVLFAKNYKQESKQNGMVENDIHHQYVDFIIRTALYHRELDNPTTVGSGVESITNTLKDAIDKQLSGNLSTLVGTGDISLLLDSVGWIKNAIKDGKFVQSNTVSLKSIGISENSSFYEYLVAVIILLSLTDDIQRNINTENNLKNTLVKSPAILNDGNASPDINTVSKFEENIKELTGKCKQDGALGNRILGNLCLISTLNGNTSASQSITNILAKNGNSLMKDRIMIEMYNDMVDELVKFSIIIHKELGGLVSMHANFNRTKQSSIVKNMLDQILSNKLLLTSLKDGLLARIMNKLKKFINLASLSNYTTLNAKNNYASKLFENVFLNWGNLDREAREFYRVHLHIFRKVGNMTDLPSELNGWEDINDRAENTEFLKSLNRDEIRINLMKEREGSPNVLFAKTLPFLPVQGPKAIRSVWYTPVNSRVPVQIQSNNLTESFLQDLYTCVYMGNPCNFNGIQLQTPTTYSQVESNMADFDLEDVFVIKNFIASRKQNSAPVQQENKSFDALFVEDIVSQVVWRVDERENFYRLENGNKVYATDDIRTDNCVGTHLAGDSAKCSKLVRECLLSGDKNALNDCIGNLTNANLFEVAQNECQHINPDVAIQILRTFGIGRVVTKDPVLGDINVPQSFEHWKKHTLSELKPNLQHAILNDNKLCDYLKGVIAFVTMHPVILNKNLSHDSTMSLATQPIDDPYIKALKKTPFIVPYQTQQERQIFTAKSLIKNIQYPQMTNAMPAQTPFNNVTYGGNSVGLLASNSLSGGGAYEESVMRKLKRNGSTAQLIKSLMENLFDEMKNSGIPLNERDRARINDGISKLESGEKSLGKFYSMLRALTDLALFFKASGCNQHTGELKELSLDSIKSRADVLTYLYQNIGDVQKCISEGVNNQNAKCKELVNFYEILVNNQSSDNKVYDM